LLNTVSVGAVVIRGPDKPGNESEVQMLSPEKQVSVIIATHNDRQNLLGCLQSLEEQDHPPALTEIVVVDDGSSDDTTAAVEHRHPRVVLVRTLHRGAEIARNRGVDRSAGELIAFIDSDCLAPRTWLSSVVAHLENDERVVIGGRIIHPGDFWQRLTGVADFGEYLGCRSREVRTLPTCNMGLRRDLFQKVRFDTRMTVNADSLFAEGLRRQGATLLFDPKVAVMHRPAAGLRDLLKRARRYGRSFVEARKIDPSMRYAGFVRAGVPGVVVATFARALLDWWRLVRYRREAGFNVLEIPPAMFFLLLRRAWSLPEAVRALRSP
jgi:glycosyltransferase involved in cell wall biosynthesis